MNVARLSIAALAALCLVLVDRQPAAAEDKDTAYTVVVKKVQVKETKADGSAWDIDNGRPDLAVTVRNTSDKDQKDFTTKTRDDTFSAEFDEPTTIKVRPGQTLEFEVLDKDVAVSDTIGKVRKEMTAEVLGKGTLKLEKFNQVIVLEVTVKKL